MGFALQGPFPVVAGQRIKKQTPANRSLVHACGSGSKASEMQGSTPSPIGRNSWLRKARLAPVGVYGSEGETFQMFAPVSSSALWGRFAKG